MSSIYIKWERPDHLPTTSRPPKPDMYSDSESDDDYPNPPMQTVYPNPPMPDTDSDDDDDAPFMWYMDEGYDCMPMGAPDSDDDSDESGTESD